METNNDYRLVPSFGNSFGTGWQVMMDNFLRLFLVIIVLSIVAAPFKMFNWSFDNSDLDIFSFEKGFDFGHNMKSALTLGSLGIFAAFFVLIGMLYAFLIAPVFEFGGDMIFVQAVRKIKPDFEYLIKGFMES